MLGLSTFLTLRSGSTILAVIAARNRKISLHRQWMARSFLYSHTIPLAFRFIWILLVVLGNLEEVWAFEVGGWIIASTVVPLGELFAWIEDKTNFMPIYSSKSYAISKTKLKSQ